MVSIIFFSFITIISIITTCNKLKKNKMKSQEIKQPYKSDSSGTGSIYSVKNPTTSKKEEMETVKKCAEKNDGHKTEKGDKILKTEEEDLFGDLAKKLAKKERTEKTESLKRTDEKNPLYDANRGSGETVRCSLKMPVNENNNGKSKNVRTEETQESIQSKIEVTKTQKTEIIPPKN
ncbi:unnamed protein product [Caenorhabditis angaria]|uniref:Uncharacterized protein n=1 Tax=Caenorhabditis angaria TaxID=860376 RepID=A0A9P1MXD6_9PELO|nr:unnamed protein product [Caenorhabditis angaria]